ncbi:MAG: tetraacyldisaccharide 4'-kinase [Spirochaetia bacterium]|nr:tetraacyldisaccharide 4'-kinase [Spirochaetia bacterium]
MIELLSRIYLALHLFVFRRRKARSVKFPMRVVSIGNLSMGGTGKTPLVAYLAQKSSKLNPMVVLRGYGGTSSGLVSDGQRVVSNFDQAGDEAMLLAQISGLRVAAGSDRAHLIRTYGDSAKIIFLDDAFQNPSIQRDVDLVLIDASLAPQSLRVLPGGKFRENVDALERANAVLLTRADSPHASAWISKLRVRFPRLPVFQSVHEFAGLSPLVQRAGNAGSVKKQKTKPGLPKQASAFCGIGNPRAFFEMLTRAGIDLKRRRDFGDHHRYSSREVNEFVQGTGPWITTEKDAVRLRAIELDEAILKSIWIARLSLRITVGEKTFLKLVLGNSLKAKNRARPGANQR